MTGRVCALVALLALAAGGCGEPRSGAVGETGPCAQVVPIALAQARAEGGGRLIGVHALKRAQLRTLIRALGAAAGPPPPPRKGCLMIYRGSFAGGRYMVLVISVRHPRLLAKVVAPRVPPAAQHAR